MKSKAQGFFKSRFGLLPVTIWLLLLLSACNQKSTSENSAITKVQTNNSVAPQSLKQTYVPVDFSYNGSTTLPNTDDEDSSKPEQIIDESKRPIDLKSGPFKDQTGLFLEIDLTSEKVLTGSNTLYTNKDYYNVTFLDGKVLCRFNSSKEDCTDLFSNKTHTRSNPLKSEQQIQSLIIPIAGLDYDSESMFSYLNDLTHRLGPAENTKYRYHYFEKDKPESKIFPANASKLLLSSILINEISSSNLQEETKVPEKELVLLPKDATGKEQYFKMRGKYLYLRLDDYDLEMPFFRKSDLSDNPELRLKNSFLECMKKDETWENKELAKENCKPVLNYHSYSYGDTQGHRTELFIKYESYDIETHILKLKINEQEYYASLASCEVEFHTKCVFVDFPETAYQNDLKRLAKIKRDKSYSDLNELIANLAPCLKAKDIECIRKYILKPEEVHATNEEGCIDSSVTLPNYEFTANDIPELEKCMNYDSLLFHREALKGINKYCFIAPDYIKKENVPARIMAVGGLDLLKSSYLNYSGSNDLTPPLSDYKVRTLDKQDWPRGP